MAAAVSGCEAAAAFAAESKFHIRTDASKAAVVALAARLQAAGGPRLIDVQWTTPHLRSLGARDVARPEYLRRLQAALALPPALTP